MRRAQPLERSLHVGRQRGAESEPLPTHGVLELEPYGVQCLAAERGDALGWRFAPPPVDRVGEQRMANGGEMYADLVRAAGVEHAFDQGRLAEAWFEGQGCVISQAAASMLMQTVEGKTLAEIKQMDRQEMLDLLGISLTPMRVKCAMLALRTLAKAIVDYEGRRQ